MAQNQLGVSSYTKSQVLSGFRKATRWRCRQTVQSRAAPVFSRFFSRMLLTSRNAVAESNAHSCCRSDTLDLRGQFAGATDECGIARHRYFWSLN